MYGLVWCVFCFRMGSVGFIWDCSCVCIDLMDELRTSLPSMASPGMSLLAVVSHPSARSSGLIHPVSITGTRNEKQWGYGQPLKAWLLCLPSRRQSKPQAFWLPESLLGVKGPSAVGPAKISVSREGGNHYKHLPYQEDFGLNAPPPVSKNRTGEG